MSDVAPQLRLASLFTDHMVLQADRLCPLWGWDSPGRAVRVTLSSSSGRAQALSVEADEKGTFRCELPALPAGGPYTLVVEGSHRIALEDVWFGEVWLASGQSNMEWKVAASNDAQREIAAAEWPQIRAFKVEPRTSSVPLDTCAGAWSVCSPRTVADFSAAGYFFARELHRERGVPVGIIDATWGGTCIEAWTSLRALAPVLADLDAQRAELEAALADLPRLQADYSRAVLEWQRAHLPVDDVNAGLERGFASPLCDDSAWPELELPTFWQTHGMSFNGVVWFRRTVDIPPELAGRDLDLSLGAVDDFDNTYFDGVEIGSTPPGTLDSHRLCRRYTIPARLATRGSHALAVRVFDHFGAGGFAGPSGEMWLQGSGQAGPRLPLAGPWRCAVEREIPLVPMSVFSTCPRAPLALAQQNAPAALFHGMIAPLIPYALRGALWYQGESNVERHQSYRALQIAMLRDWRTRWGQGQLPFYYVQLANYVASASWPLLREAQAEACTEPETGMVVTLDIGDANDIHPTNKQEVGRRLSLWARARAYGETSLVHEGPRLARVLSDGPRARVKLANADGLRTCDGQPPRGFSVAGGDGRYVPARAVIEGDEVLLTSPDVPSPCSVRYAFTDHLEVNLENGAGLPAAPFRTDPYP